MISVHMRVLFDRWVTDQIKLTVEILLPNTERLLPKWFKLGIQAFFYWK
jgi:hypothetical protein